MEANRPLMNAKRLKPLMIGGTGSDVGKSLLVAGLCRIFKQDGYNPAPFKAQNMALNSYVTADGLELGRAQAVQAEAAGIDCSTDMNPVLLKPIGDCISQVVLHGKPIGNRSAKEYFSNQGRKILEDEVHMAYARLCGTYNPIVLEGAGSIAELNLMHLDIVNMPMARYADANVILVADISRGGVFASLYGSIMLQRPDDKKRIKGLIVNKFRGDSALFESGCQQLQDICGVPIVGVMPYLNDLYIEEEDAYFRKNNAINHDTAKINIAIIRLPHISNFTDFDPLEIRKDVNLFYTTDCDEITQSDIIIIPGTKATISDLAEIYSSGVANAIIKAYNARKTIIGICGGYQMMGNAIHDPLGIEGNTLEIKGLGILPIETTITTEKLTRRIEFTHIATGQTGVGYEIHMGKTSILEKGQPFALLKDGSLDGCRLSDKCWGTYLHGLFENSCIQNELLAPLAQSLADNSEYKTFKEKQYDRLASEMRKHLNIDLIYKIITTND